MSRRNTRRLLQGSQIVLLAAGAVALAYCAFVLADTWMFQRRANLALDRLRLTPAALRPSTPPGRAAAALDGWMGRMEIPRIGVSVMIAEGTDEKTLRRAAGHIAGTALPGRAGNVGIAGHRDTLFRSLHDIRQDDVITLTMPDGEYRYRVVSTQVVSPYDVSVLNPDGSEILTLVTCYPFYFIGPAPDRFVVRAARVT